MLSVEGRLDTQTAPEFEPIALQKVSETTKLALNVEKLQYISSAGLRILLQLMKKSKAKGGSVVLIALNDMVKDVIEESGIDSFFDCYESLEELP